MKKSIKDSLDRIESQLSAKQAGMAILEINYNPDKEEMDREAKRLTCEYREKGGNAEFIVLCVNYQSRVAI